MRNSDDPKSQYVDISYGWQNRDEATRLQLQRRRWRWAILGGLFAGAALVYLLWRLS